MQQYLARRLSYTVLTLVGLTLVVFVLVRLVPGDVVTQMIDSQAQTDPAQVERLRAFFGLDRSWYVQYLGWINSLLHGDLGRSWRLGGTVWDLLWSRMSVTIELTLLATAISALIGIAVGVVAALRRDRPADRAIRVFSLAGLSVPAFWQGSMLILVFSLYFRWTPPLRWISPLDDALGNLALMALPALTLGTAGAAVVVRMTRNAMLEVMSEDYVRTARGKGLAEQVILARHALRNALIPVITVVGLQMGALLGGAVVVEEVFTIPGVGRLLLQSLTQRDYPVVEGTVFFIAVLLMAINLATDMLYSLIDPRVRYS